MEIANQVVSIFCEIDDFCKEWNQHMKHKLLPRPHSRHRGPRSGFSLSEIMTILVMFHKVRFRDFKTFYTGFLERYWHSYFPNLPSYSRFVALMKRALFPLTLFTQLKTGKQTGIYYIDSSCLAVCHIKRSKRHKTFDHVVQYGRTSMCWFFRLKMHLVTNDRGVLMAFKITQGHRIHCQEATALLHHLESLAFGDKGYISQAVFETLLTEGLKLITRKRKNMKQGKRSYYETQLLNQRGIIEAVIGHLKHHYQVWHTRHRSVVSAMTRLVSALAAYTIEPLQISATKFIRQMP